MMDCAHCFNRVSDHPRCKHCGQTPLLDGRYALLDIIGEGAQGTTYRARRVETGEVVAIKELVLRKASSWKALEQLEREANTLAELDHPAVPQFHESFTVDSLRAIAFYIVQDLVDGTPLSEVGRLSLEDALGVAIELLEILADLHERPSPVVHRDIKPENVIWCSDGSLALVDFGSVRSAGTLGSTIAGTFGYMAPEQLAGRAVPESDVYGAGVTLLWLLSGLEPADFVVGSQLRWKEMVEVPDRVETVLTSILASSPESRPVASEAARRLREAGARGAEPTTAMRARNDVAPRQHTEFSPQAALQASIPYGSHPAALVGLAVVSLPMLAMPVLLDASWVVSAAFILVCGGPILYGVRRVWTKHSRKQNAVERGPRAVGRIASTTIQGQRFRYHYVFQLSESGPVYSGECYSWKLLPVQEGSDVLVAYSADHPEANVMVSY